MPEFPNADHVAAGRADDIFRHLAPDAPMWTGDDQTVGWVVSMMEVTREDLIRAVAATGNAWASGQGAVERGWYLIHVNSDGLIWAHFYKNQTLANRDFADAEEQYNIDSGWTDTPIIDYDENGNEI